MLRAGWCGASPSRQCLQSVKIPPVVAFLLHRRFQDERLLPQLGVGENAPESIQADVPFSPGINEAASTVTGTYRGKRTTGQAYVEQFGIWK